MQSVESYFFPEFFVVGDYVKLGKHIYPYEGDPEADFVVVAVEPDGQLTVESPNKTSSGLLSKINPTIFDLCDARGNILWKNPYARV